MTESENDSFNINIVHCANIKTNRCLADIKHSVNQNIELKLSMFKYTSHTLDKMGDYFATLNDCQKRILFQSGILTERIIFSYNHENLRQSRMMIGQNFGINLIELGQIQHDVQILLPVNDDVYKLQYSLLKPMLYYSKKTLKHLVKRNLADCSVVDSAGCPVYLDLWRVSKQNKSSLLEFEDTINCLQHAKGDLCGRNANGDTLLHIIAQGYVSSDFLQNLTDSGLIKKLINIPNNAGVLPLHVAFKFGMNEVPTQAMLASEIIQLFIDEGADVNAAISGTSLTILHMLVYGNWKNKLPHLENQITLLNIFKPYLQNIPDLYGVTPLNYINLYPSCKEEVLLREYISNSVNMTVRDTLATNCSLNFRVTQNYSPNQRKLLSGRIKHGIQSDTGAMKYVIVSTVNQIENFPSEDASYMNYITTCKNYFQISSPWSVRPIANLIEGTIINVNNKQDGLATLNCILYYYLKALNVKFLIPNMDFFTISGLDDHNFQCSKHLFKIVRAIGHLRNENIPVSHWIDLFLEFIENNMLPFYSKKLLPSHFNAVGSMYIEYFMADTIHHINLVLWLWWSEVSGAEKERAREIITNFFAKLSNNPNTKLSLFALSLTSIITQRIKLVNEIKVNPLNVLTFLKEFGEDVNKKMPIQGQTPLFKVIKEFRSSKILIKVVSHLLELGAYVYARDKDRKGLKEIVVKDSHLYNIVGFDSVTPLSAICADYIALNDIPIGPLACSQHLNFLINLHKSNC